MLRGAHVAPTPKMHRMKEIFAEVRRRSGFSGHHFRAAFAAQLGIPDARLAALEAQAAVPTVDELDRLARLVGVESDELSEAVVERSPMAHLLMRGQSKSGQAALRSLAPSQSLAVLGDFVRILRLLGKLESVRATQTDALLRLIDRRVPSTKERAPYGAPEAAAALRTRLNMAQDAPIASMRKMLDNLGIATIFVDAGQMDASLDGASVALPVAGVLVHLVGGPECWWRTRTTMAHELCHLLLDHQAGDGRMALISPRSSGQFSGPQARSARSFFQGFNVIEARASAFAAHLLVPSSGVLRVAAGLDPTSEAAITRVCREFGVGRLVAINRLCQTFDIGSSARTAMEARGSAEPHRAEHPDVVARREVGLRSGALREAVFEGLRRGSLDPLAARVALRLPLTEPLPAIQGIAAAALRPLQQPEVLVLRRAQALLDTSPQPHAHFAASASATPTGWLVQTVDASAGPQGAPGKPLIQISFDLERAGFLDSAGDGRSQ